MQTVEMKLKECEGLVHLVIARLPLSSTHKWVLYDDLMGWGLVGLVEAMNKYDSKYDTEFKSYAYTRIMGTIKDFLRSWDHLGRMTRTDIKKMSGFIGRYINRHNRLPTEGEIARAIKIKVGRVREAVKLNRIQVELDGMNNKDMFPPPIVDKRRPRIPDRYEDIEDAVERLLSARERQVVEMRFDQGLTQKEAGRQINLSESRICQIEKKAIGILQEKLVG